MGGVNQLLVTNCLRQLDDDATPERELAARVVLSAVGDCGDQQLGQSVGEAGAVATVAGLAGGSSTLRRAAGYQVRLATWDERGGISGLLGEVARSLQRIDARVIVPGDSEWPTQLDDLGPWAPLVLFVRGHNLRLAAVRSVAIVGARAASSYGVAVATDLAADLADRGWAIVSGGAYGIDAAAHRGALAAGGQTIGVLACGLDVAYPKGHDALFQRLAADGTLVSELPPGQQPTKSRFLTRNRLIAALSRASIVVEAALRSGSLNTAAAARQLGRPVMAVPGPITSAMSAGVHHLLRTNYDTARLVTGADEVIEDLGPLGSYAPEPPRPTRPWDGLDEVTSRVFEALPADRGVGVAVIAAAAALTPDETLAGLHRLRILDLAEQDDTGWRINRGALNRPSGA